MKYLTVIQARCGSTRLPNKVMTDICGKPDIRWVIERASRSRYSDEVMLITSLDRENIPLVHLCSGLGIRVYAGSEDDVLDRYYQVAKLMKPEYIIRLTGDCPLFDWRYLDFAIEGMNDDTDYLWMGENTFPDGLDFEIMTFRALRRTWHEAEMQSEREHVTPYIRNHPEIFNIQIYDFPIKNTGHYRWTLDEDRDLELICSLYQHFLGQNREDFVTEEVIDYLHEHPEIERLNAGIIRNEGLAKSIENDRSVIKGDE